VVQPGAGTRGCPQRPPAERGAETAACRSLLSSSSPDGGGDADNERGPARPAEGGPARPAGGGSARPAGGGPARPAGGVPARLTESGLARRVPLEGGL
jgi:hypothetical protein